jgi:hypothetical protein
MPPELQHNRAALHWIEDARRVGSVHEALGRCPHYSTVTLLARFLGLSTSVPRATAVW